MVKQLGNYTIDLEGNVLPGPARHARPVQLGASSLRTKPRLARALRARRKRASQACGPPHRDGGTKRWTWEYEDDSGSGRARLLLMNSAIPASCFEEFAGSLPLACWGPVTGLEQQQNLSPGI